MFMKTTVNFNVSTGHYFIILKCNAKIEFYDIELIKYANHKAFVSNLKSSFYVYLTLQIKMLWLIFVSIMGENIITF